MRSRCRSKKIKNKNKPSFDFRICLRQPQSRWNFKVWTALKLGNLWGRFWWNIWRQLVVELSRSNNSWVIIHSSEIQTSLWKFRVVTEDWGKHRSSHCGKHRSSHSKVLFYLSEGSSQHLKLHELKAVHWTVLWLILAQLWSSFCETVWILGIHFDGLIENSSKETVAATGVLVKFQVWKSSLIKPRIQRWSKAKHDCGSVLVE